MRNEGFTVTAKLDASTGLIYGELGEHRRTWMDKMGSAVGLNQGEPATPRDGAAIEITGLLYSAVRWVERLASSSITSSSSSTAAAAEQAIGGGGGGGGGGGSIKQPSFSFKGVTLPDNSFLSFADWGNRIQANFERLYYIPTLSSSSNKKKKEEEEEEEEEEKSFSINSSLVNRRGIYKDVVGASAEWNDYQLRPNFVIAMSVAPSLFSSSRRANHALCAFEQFLLGKLGVKTLDPSDWAYRGDYDNSRNDGVDKSTANGWNYHQGPEWLWPLGYFLRARMNFPPPRSAFPTMSDTINDNKNDGDGGDNDDSNFSWPSYEALKRYIYARLSPHRSHMESSPHGALPELTNANGAFCKDSCVVQAWSSATLLDTLYDLHCLQQEEEEG